jgi:hypothetical protein
VTIYITVTLLSGHVSNKQGKAECFVLDPSQDLDFLRHMSWSFCVQWVQLRWWGGCLFCWYWWNWWPSLRILSFHIILRNISLPVFLRCNNSRLSVPKIWPNVQIIESLIWCNGTYFKCNGTYFKCNGTYFRCNGTYVHDDIKHALSNWWLLNVQWQIFNAYVTSLTIYIKNVCRNCGWG